ncbi:Glycosyltransferase involved in cell wall bisynthesis [Verrucomicrobium sp. GAS474]|uniref:glycosyltransferase n=1 Tax=Verrucomicrobium sp. GAS474 TaxID=1882831 RepID=UPI00087C0FEE|nr:glycosyltransferase [Verrucomicrobium sp. GAS474]SDT87714.1 Glycosyltransferase involved in cell wall bisynthesis [Verrucomicrobium sp. GAS474]
MPPALFLDVSSTARHRVQTGVQRVVRGLHGEIANRGGAGMGDGNPVRPVGWSNSFLSYCTLREEEYRNLVDPFGSRKKKGPSSRPDLLHNPYPWSKTFRWLFQALHRIAVPDRVGEGGWLLVPEIFQDKRIEYFAANLPLQRGKSAALYYDALAWSSPEFFLPGSNPRFTDYLAALARFDLVVSDSREAEAELIRFWEANDIAATRTCTLPLPMPLGNDEARPVPGEAAAAHARRRLLVVATLEPRKNHLRLLEACRLLWEQGHAFSLDLVGRSLGAGSAAVVAEIERLRAAGRPLTWHAHIDDAGLARAYAESSFTVFPSLREGFGLPILESLWHGRPCLCSAAGALGEVAEGGGCLTEGIEAANTASLAHGIERLLSDPALHARLFAEAAARPFRRWGDYARELTALLEQHR